MVVPAAPASVAASILKTVSPGRMIFGPPPSLPSLHTVIVVARSARVAVASEKRGKKSPEYS